MKKFLFITISLILLIVGCAPKYMIDGKKLYNKKQYQQALELFKQEREKNPQSAEAYMWKGKCYFALGRYSEASLSMEEALLLDPDNSKISNLLQYYKICKQNKEKEEAAEARLHHEWEMKRYIDKGISLYKKGYFDNAEGKFDNAVRSALAYKLDYEKYYKEDSDLHQLYRKAEKWKKKAAQKLIQQRLDEFIAYGIEEFNKGYYVTALKIFEKAIKDTCENDMYSICIGCGWGYYVMDENIKDDSTLQYQLCKKAVEWANKAVEKKWQRRDEIEKEFEQRLMEARKNYGKYFKEIIIHFSKDSFTGECLIPHCENYKVWTSGPGYKYINVSSPYMDKWRADYLLNILTYIGNFTQDNLKVMEEYYQFTRIYWRNSRTGKGWVYHSYWDVRNK